MNGTTTALALPDQWRRDVESYEKQKYNVLVPREIGQIPPFHVPHMSVIQVDPDRDAGETYPLPGGKIGLSKVVLDKIAQAGSITWIPDQCTGGWLSPRKYQYKAVGVVKGLDGQRRTIIGSKEIDLDVIEEELRASVPRREKCPTKEPERSRWIETTIRDEMISFKKHIAARTESGAKNRAIRSAYGLKSSYTRDEIARPFVIPRLVLSPDMSDPEVKKMVLGEALGIIPELYGHGPTPPLPPALPPAPDDEPETETSTAQAPTHGTEPLTLAEDPDLADEAAFLEAVEAESSAKGDDLKKALVAKQLGILKDLMVRKGYRGDKLKRPLAEFSREERLGFLKHLLAMPDVHLEPPPPDTAQAALPWDK